MPVISIEFQEKALESLKGNGGIEQFINPLRDKIKKFCQGKGFPNATMDTFMTTDVIDVKITGVEIFIFSQPIKDVLSKAQLRITNQNQNMICVFNDADVKNNGEDLVRNEFE